MKNKNIKWLIALLLSCVVSTCFYIAKQDDKKETKNNYHEIIVVESGDKKVLEKDTIINSLHEMAELTIFTINYSKEIKIKSGGIFFTEQSQNIKFNMTGEYYIDLNNINNDNVTIENSTITIYSKPLGYKIYYNENLTEFSEVIRHWYTIGSNLEVAPEYIEKIKAELKNSIIEEMDLQIEDAESKASESIKNILFKLTNDKYKIDVIFVK